MLFIHRRTLTKARALAFAINVAGFLLFLGLATYFVFFQEKPSVIWFGKAVFAIAALTLPIVIWQFIRLFSGTGEWHIHISENELIWQVPDNIGERSFSLPIADISKIVRESPKHNAETADWYYLETRSGERHPLNPSVSGVNLNTLCNALEKLGVKLETRRSP